MTLNNFIDQLTQTLTLMKEQAPIAGGIIAGLWIIYFVNSLVGKKLFVLGIYPRHWFGLIGIPFSPLLHADLNHLIFNSIPLFVLMCFVLTAGLHQFIFITLLIILLSGLGIWLFGRSAIHIGASALIMGYFGYLLADAYQHPSVSTMAIGFLCIYYFGGLIFSLFPSEEKVSWEGHAFGFLAGIAVSLLLL